MKEEDILLKKLGKENSFKGPDGYFENLTSEVMNKLPEKERRIYLANQYPEDLNRAEAIGYNLIRS